MEEDRAKMDLADQGSTFVDESEEAGMPAQRRGELLSQITPEAPGESVHP